MPHRWVCANIEPDGVREVKTAVATFTYPVGGRIIFRQEADEPLADTSVYVEGLVSDTLGTLFEDQGIYIVVW